MYDKQKRFDFARPEIDRLLLKINELRRKEGFLKLYVEEWTYYIHTGKKPSAEAMRESGKFLIHFG